ncbi:AAA family ATPase [Burkholderia cenocepacia]|uniref:AAA family ATPase n=1 Tax=Burkholderia cenocepacia TaxID=95486 RepID=UPI002AB2BB34|nr:AAA family ATPase [Burkholderia cenocepacia]
MARSDLIVNLVRASALGDQKIIRGTVEALVAEERAKNHHLLAEKISDIYESTRKKMSKTPLSRFDDVAAAQAELKFNSNSSDLSELLHELHPTDGLDNLFLDAFVRESCRELITEQLNSDLLRNHAVEPRNRIVLSGPPGNGKTSLARAVAFELGLPMYVIKYESIFGSFLGETSARLRKVFEFVRSRPCVLFFDEFDTLGKERGDVHETGEIKRVVSALLLQIDDLPTHNIIIAATNHSELIDRAAWRRFQLRLELLPPSLNELEHLIVDFESKNGEQLEGIHEILLNRLSGMSYADVEQFFLDVKRVWIVRGKSRSLREIVETRLDSLDQRFKIKINSEKNEQSSVAGVAEGDTNSA